MENLAETLLSASRVNVHATPVVPAHAPPHTPLLLPARMVTVVPATNLNLQKTASGLMLPNWQSVVAAVGVTSIVSSRLCSTYANASSKVGAGGTGGTGGTCSSNLALTVTNPVPVIVTVHVPVPEHPPPPDQPTKSSPLAAAAVNVTTVPVVNVREHVVPQSIPPTLLETVPLPAPVFDTNKSESAVGLHPSVIAPTGGGP